MSQFNSYQNKKDTSAQDDINQRMSAHTSLFLPNQNNTPNNKYKSDNLLGTNYSSQIPPPTNQHDKSNFKDQINNRIDTFQRNIEVGQRQLPFNNNIRDYSVTCDSKKDIFNNRLSNYNYLSSNIPPQIQEQNSFNASNFHTSFREDTNNRLQELSPLSRNIGMPTMDVNPPSVPDFNKNLPVENYHPTPENSNYSNQFTNQSETGESTQIYLENYQKMSSANQSSILSNSYDTCNYGIFANGDSNTQSSYSSTPNKLYSQQYNPQSEIKNFDYSLINNSMNPNQKQTVDSVNKLPKLAVNTNLPVDTRQEFHFHQNFS